jgi:hypothetical protein
MTRRSESTGPSGRSDRSRSDALPEGPALADHLAAFLATQGQGDAEEIRRRVLEGQGRQNEMSSGPSTSAPKVRESSRRETARDLSQRVQRRFAGKLRLGDELEQPEEVPQPVAAPGAATGPVFLGIECRAKAPALPSQNRPMGRMPPALTRQQRRVLVRSKERQLEGVSRRFAVTGDPEREGVWSREVYRRIRAAVQDASGKAAECVLYMLGSAEAVKLAETLNPRIPMDRRKIAFLYAVTNSPGSALGTQLKLGFALGLFSKVLADPNNPNMERRRRFCPSRRTLSTDLTWLEGEGLLRRWQVPAEVADPCEMKRGPYPTNRYFARQQRAGDAMMSIARALGDVPPVLLPNPAEGWSAEDAAALEEVRALLLADPSAGPRPDPLPSG